MINHKSIIRIFAGMAALLFATHVSLVNADQGATDPTNATAINIPIPGSLKYENARHVANGVALTNRTSGTIHLRGVPADAVVHQAWLYFNYSDANAVGPNWAQAYIDGHRVSGKKVADNLDPCWGAGGNHTYRAAVTAFLPTRRPNGDYTVALLLPSSVLTPGTNPWGPPISNNHVKGATLVVIYKNNNVPYTNFVIMYDALSGTMFSGVGAFELSHGFGAGAGLLTMPGADGQRGGIGYSNSLSNETTTLNGVQIAGPPVAGSDWDGSDGWPLPQLWDTHTHSVLFAGVTESIVYTAAGDCLLPVVFVIQI